MRVLQGISVPTVLTQNLALLVHSTTKDASLTDHSVYRVPEGDTAMALVL